MKGYRMKLANQFDKIKSACHAFCEQRKVPVDEIVTGADAWTVFSRSGVSHEVYADRTVTDGHIQTVLEKVFPNAVFKDRRVY